ncbi:hypothetical protein LJY25_16810 [Hymenobacter sp. BT175]|uniref:hypothetical protein n=1 Tax=Hymenobacter translucens TaxID=2886507 RepID=UPI001D0E06AA|nr:hypothetical protein [Hymenobacter translucens]MCC2548113.1 hypothetical protein [Hymenobacter translucens]
MKRLNYHIVCILIFIASCTGTKSIDRGRYTGNLKEQNYPFFESISHGDANSNSYTIPFDLKFIGIKPHPYDSTGKQDFSWLRSPNNLLITFNTIKSIGLEKFVSFEQYNRNTNDWCCNTQWENKSLNEVIKGFIQSDTLSSNGGYYSKFWGRRRKEGNMNVTYHILKEIHKFYNGEQIKITTSPIDTTLKGLLNYDLQLANSSSNSYKNIAIKYFNYLKSVHLEYSAYKLISHNTNLKLPKEYTDSLLTTLDYDTISFEAWKRMDDNYNGWMTAGDYPDPNRYYGP